MHSQALATYLNFEQYFGVHFPGGVFFDRGCPHEGKGTWDGLGAWIKSAHDYAILREGQKTRSMWWDMLLCSAVTHPVRP